MGTVHDFQVEEGLLSGSYQQQAARALDFKPKQGASLKPRARPREADPDRFVWFSGKLSREELQAEKSALASGAALLSGGDARCVRGFIPALRDAFAAKRRSAY